MHKKEFTIMFYKVSLVFFLMFFVVNLSVNAQEKPTPPVPTPVLTAEQMESAIVVSDMRATNRVMAGPNETVVYRLADCDTRDENAPCYASVSATIVPIENPFSHTQVQSNSSINRGVVLQCGRSICNAVGWEVGRLIQNVALTFHTNNDSTPLTLNWGDSASSIGSLVLRWISISGPVPNPGWGTYAWNDASANTSALGEYGTYSPIGWIATYPFSAGVRLVINRSGWGCL